MKKTIALFLALLLLITAAACGAKDNGETTITTTTESETFTDELGNPITEAGASVSGSDGSVAVTPSVSEDNDSPTKTGSATTKKGKPSGNTATTKKSSGKTTTDRTTQVQGTKGSIVIGTGDIDDGWY